MNTIKLARTILFGLAIVLTVMSLAVTFANWDSIQQNLGIEKWIYALPAIIGLIVTVLALVMDEYLKAQSWQKAVAVALGSLSITGFVILFRLIF